MDLDCLAHKNGMKVRYTGTKEYFCVPDVVEVLGLKKRHNYNGKTVKKLKATSKNRGPKLMVFLHHKDMEWLIRKSNRPAKKKWLLKEVCGVVDGSERRNGNGNGNAVSNTKATSTVSNGNTATSTVTAAAFLDVWDNYLDDFKRKMIRRDLVVWPAILKACPELAQPPRYDFPYSVYDHHTEGSLYVQRRVPDNKLWLCLADLERLFEIYLHNKAALGIREHTYDRNFGGDTYEQVTHEFIPAHHFATVYSQKRGKDEDAYRAIMTLLAGSPCKICGQNIKKCD